jgi:hypothetical protein
MSGVMREAKARRYFVPKSEAARIKAKRNAIGGDDRDINHKTA